MSDLVPGECFGEDDLMKERPRTVNAISMSHSTKAYTISK